MSSATRSGRGPRAPRGLPARHRGSVATCTPGIGSRSTRSSSGWSRSSASTGCGLRSTQPRLIAQARPAASWMTASLAEVPRGVPQLGDVHPVRPLLRCALLKDRLVLDALDEPLQDHRAPGHAAQGAVGDGQVVVDQVQLGVAGPALVTGKDHFVRVGDFDLASAHVQCHRPHGSMVIPGGFSSLAATCVT